MAPVHPSKTVQSQEKLLELVTSHDLRIDIAVLRYADRALTRVVR